MRKINTEDCLKACTLVNTLGIRDEVKSIMSMVRSGGSVSPENVGIELFLNILSHAGTEACRRALYDFLSGPLEISSKEVAESDPFDLYDKIVECVQLTGKDRWLNFFKLFGRMIQPES